MRVHLERRPRGTAETARGVIARRGRLRPRCRRRFGRRARLLGREGRRLLGRRRREHERNGRVRARSMLIILVLIPALLDGGFFAGGQRRRLPRTRNQHPVTQDRDRDGPAMCRVVRTDAEGLPLSAAALAQEGNHAAFERELVGQATVLGSEDPAKARHGQLSPHIRRKDDGPD